MTPVTNKPPMPQAPGKGISSFPTPVIDDVVITEIVNAWKGNYTPLEYGAKWDDVSHASMQGSHPDHKLVYQEPASQDGEWIKRIWVNDRINQDSYNYAIKYSGGSQQHPIYIRTYILPREGYAPLPDLTPDEIYPTALLVEEEVQRNEGELDSKYIKVIRVFETLQGPEITSYRYNERGDLETITNQQVSPTTPPDPDGLLVTQSQVVKQDVSKGTKTTATVESYTTLSSKEKKAGLLGETITTDNIVAPSTQPDALSQSIVASSVEQTSATKARKRTTTSIGPTSLTQKSKDGKLLGDVTVTESIVDPTTSADSPNGVTSGILTSEVKQIDSGKAIKTNTVLNSTPTLLGSKKSSGLLGTTTTLQSVVAAGSDADSLTLNIISSEVEPIDSLRSRKVTQTSSGPTILSITSLIDSPVGKVAASVQKSIVSPSTVPQGSKLTLDDKIESIDESKAQRDKITVSSYPDLTTYDLDEVLNTIVINERKVINHNDPYAAPLLALSVTDRPIDQWKTLRITSRLNNIPETRTEYKTQQFTFPALLESVTVLNSSFGFGRVPINDTDSVYKTGINKYVSVQPKLRPAISLPTKIKIVTNFFSGPPPLINIPSVYQIKTQNISYNGSLFSMNFGDVLTNGFTVGPINANSFDPRFSGLSESIQFSASAPTYSQYVSNIGTEQVIFCNVDYYKSNIYIVRTGYITLI